MNQSDDVRITRFDPAYVESFADLNYEWIEQYFVVEDKDREILEDPVGQIIDVGGEIFFAVIGDTAVGTAALIDTSEDSFELAKMAVSPNYRGRGIADGLIRACIEHAKIKGKSRIFLLSNTKLQPAMALYRKHGFVEINPDEQSPYERVNIVMELALNRSKL